MRSFIAIADAALACAMATAYLGGLVVGFTIDHRDQVGSTHLISLALALLSVKTGIARAYATHGRTVALTLRSIWPKSLFSE